MATHKIPDAAASRPRPRETMLRIFSLLLPRRDGGPAVDPRDGPYSQADVAAHGPIVEVVRHDVAVDRLPAGPEHGAVLGEDHGSAAVLERSAEPVEVRAVGRLRSPDGDL